jgi:hypothetical protein
VADLARHPLNDPTPAGGDGCQGWSSERKRPNR